MFGKPKLQPWKMLFVYSTHFQLELRKIHQNYEWLRKKKSLPQSTSLLNNVILSKVCFWFLPKYLEAYYKCASAPYIRGCCYITGKEKQTKASKLHLWKTRYMFIKLLLSCLLQYSTKIEALFLRVVHIHLCTILFIYSDSYQV